MPKNFTAITESGAIYQVKDGHLEYSGSHGDYGFKLRSLKAFDRADPYLTWDKLQAVPEVDLPEVGKAIFISDGYDWRISTNVVSVTAD